LEIYKKGTSEIHFMHYFLGFLNKTRSSKRTTIRLRERTVPVPGIIQKYDTDR